MGELTWRTTLEPRGPAAAVILDDDQVAEVGEGRRAFPVQATINGYTWPGRVSRMGGEFMLGLRREVREAAGVEAGDEVTVTVVLDEAPREVEVPAALADALAADADAKARFDGLAFTHRKEFAQWVAEAKKDETRARRVEQAIQMLHQGKTRS
jgi:8-oxo-dGTP pyrophosphatase MutT (NUDIX family)